MTIPLSLLSSSVFLKDINTRVYSDGTVVFYRVPLWNNLDMDHQQEVVTQDGRTCSSTIGRSTYEKTTTNTITYKLVDSLMPCVEVGATHRVSRKYMFFRPSVTETIIEPAENL